MSNVRRYEPFRPFAPRADGTIPFGGILPRDVPTPEGVLEHVIQGGDRSDALAHHYYDDSRLWFHILDADPQLECGSDLREPQSVGHRIVVPAAPAPTSSK